MSCDVAPKYIDLLTNPWYPTGLLTQKKRPVLDQMIESNASWPE